MADANEVQPNATGANLQEPDVTESRQPEPNMHEPDVRDSRQEDPERQELNVTEDNEAQFVVAAPSEAQYYDEPEPGFCEEVSYGSSSGSAPDSTSDGGTHGEQVHGEQVHEAELAAREHSHGRSVNSADLDACDRSHGRSVDSAEKAEDACGWDMHPESSHEYCMRRNSDYATYTAFFQR